jgi:hypothetical protein
LLRDNRFDFYQPQIFTTISLVLVFGNWLGFGLTMHALQVLQSTEERKIKRNIRKIQLIINGNNHGK